jgi:hypothetical protein
MSFLRAVARLGVVAVLVSVAPSVRAGAHTWDVNEVFMNADGTIWFIELREANGTPNEVNTAGRPVRSVNTGNVVNICCNVTAPTTNKHFLLASPAFAALPGAPTPNQIVNVNGFFLTGGDTVQYQPYDSWAIGGVPTDGINSLNRTGIPFRANTPTNYAGVTGTVDASGPEPPPAVPDGREGSTPLLAQRLDAGGSSIEVTWDTTTCSDNAEHVLVWGGGADLPSSPGGAFSLGGAECGLGGSSSFTWSPTPEIADGTGLLWWLVVVQDGDGVEGSWGAPAGIERVGPGPEGSSGLCGATTRDVTNTCGN